MQNVGLDIFYLHDADKRIFPMLNCTDFASRFQLCWPLADKSPEVVIA